MKLSIFEKIVDTNKLINITTRSYPLKLLFILKEIEEFEVIDKLF